MRMGYRAAAAILTLSVSMLSSRASDFLTETVTSEGNERIEAADGGNVSVSGELSVGARLHFGPPQFPGQVDGLMPLLEGSVRLDYESDDGKNRVVFEPYGRLDLRADNDVIDLRDAYILHRGDNWDILAGVHTLFWGVTEARNLVNVINQRDLGDDVVEDRALGQPMVNLNWSSPGAGTFSVYGMFGFRTRDHPDMADRLRPAMVINDSAAMFEAGGTARHLGFAARYANHFDLGAGGLDLGVQYFHGTSREPRFVMVGPDVVPFYDVMDQVGVDAVFATGDLQLKFEGIWRHANNLDFLATVAGFEYTVFTDAAGGVDIGFLGEYLYDGRPSNPALAPPTAFQNDLFGGLRLSLNDVGGTQFKAGFTYDLDNAAKSLSVDFETRLRDDLLLSIEGRTFWDMPASAFAIPHEDSFVFGKITKFF
ncbi:MULTISPECIES: hypothetical protein [unclassified Roseitalea]|uniref:hypothetical protein n=1 Tax=unclassified Roseitalea TaxID=2639107 RepID=UPI00273E59D4|nr:MULTISPECIES: hypothetical protein [unclassified Roseitalea]